jgi:hypothetical protein
MLLVFFASRCLADIDHFYDRSLVTVSQHQNHNVRPYLNASYHVARMWLQFPSEDFYQRVACFMGYGGKESGFEPNYIHYNIPGKAYPGLHGLKVRHFSVDYSWAGLNEGSVEQTYAIAKALQEGRYLSHKQVFALGFSPNIYDNLSRILKIPQNLELYKIDLSTAKEARVQYLREKRDHVSPRHIRIDVPYAEDTQDKIDSVLLYRTIEEYDRYLRGWPYQTYDSDAYYLCEKILREP